MIPHLPLGGVAILVTAVSLIAQAQPTQGRVAVPPPFASAVQLDIEPPAGEGAWVIQLISRGGIIDSRGGEWRVTSAGAITCRRPDSPCDSPLSNADVGRLSTLITAVSASAWNVSASLCSDCYQRLMVLHRREGDGVRIHMAHWNESQAVAPELRRLHDAVGRLQR